METAVGKENAVASSFGARMSCPFRCKSAIRRKSARSWSVAHFGRFRVVLCGMNGGVVRLSRTLSRYSREKAVRTENVVSRPDSAAKAFVGLGGASPADAASLIAFHLGSKWEYGRRFFLPGADAPCARHDARLCHAPLPANATRM